MEPKKVPSIMNTYPLTSMGALSFFHVSSLLKTVQHWKNPHAPFKLIGYKKTERSRRRNDKQLLYCLSSLLLKDSLIGKEFIPLWKMFNRCLKDLHSFKAINEELIKEYMNDTVF
ncbi:hypothetical protein [Lacrimispora brassicae]